MEHLRYPNESTEYRAARNALLNDEIALRAQIEAVAAKRRALPPGGEVPGDYVFERIGKNATPEKVNCTASCMDPSGSYRVPAARTCSMGSTARQGTSASELHFTSSRNPQSHGSPRGHTSAVGIISRLCLRRAIATTRIILVTPQSFPRACVHSIAFRTARTGTKRYLTCSEKMTAQSVTFGAPR